MHTNVWNTVGTATRSASPAIGTATLHKPVADTLSIPAFSITYTETDTQMSFIVGEFSLTMASVFGISTIPTNSGWNSYTLGVRDSGGQHFILRHDDEGEQFPAGIPLYNGETLAADVVFEIWSSVLAPYNNIAEDTQGILLGSSTLSLDGTTYATGAVNTALFALGTPNFALPMVFNSEQV